MKKIIVLLFALLSLLQTEAQISDRLATAIKSNTQEFYTVSISFPRNVDMIALKNELDSAQVTLHERQKTVNRVLLKDAEKAQKTTLQTLSKLTSKEVRYVQSFYIVNRIIAKLSKRAIHSLTSIPNIQEIDFASGEMEFFEPVSISETENTEAVGGIEPGLAAINAPALWKLGYTGRGRKVYIYDTGVWSTHPTIKNRFLGNFSPLAEAWYGHFAEEPNGAINSHGTHVLGTTAGLDTATHDTIGVAFGAYWMACDLISGSTAAAIPDQVYLIGAFEWALNPDGDTSTTTDIPDVINNSWRWRDIIDTAECNGFVPQLMTAIETAGIANIFSGGNTGPSNVGVNSPQRINTTEVNTFTVGSINGNAAFPQPISSFSTRGPSQCPGSGSLKIHPEVVAPGQNVRSAWGTDGYNTISGTSMASPHVSGAALLLKEAFPQLTGEQILYALYNSAVDLGVAGEDNTYGNGIIDVFAAYQLLAQTHTPADPNQLKWDVAISDVDLPQGGNITCDSLYNPQITLVNLGDSAIHSVEISVFLNGNQVGTPQTIPIANGLANLGDKHTINPNINYTLPYGKQEWSFTVNINKNEYDEVNNKKFVRFTKWSNTTLPILEDFENGVDKSRWLVQNLDYSITWDTTTVLGWSGNTQALYLNCSDYPFAGSLPDQLWSQRVVLPANTPKITLAFDVAYQSRGAILALQDTLSVWISDDCGQNFSDRVYVKHGLPLQTTAQTGRDFVPQNAQEWRREYVDLSSYAGAEVIINFEGVNKNGNNLYLDNISIYSSPFDPFGLDENRAAEFSIYPNPASETLHLQLARESHSEIDVKITDVQGKTCLTKTLTEQRSVIQIASLSPGVYVVSIKKDGFWHYSRFVKL